MRRPDALLNAQFWAEDGAFWYADAYNAGPWISLFQPENGYFQTISRLVAGISLLFPLRDAPLFFNVAAITIQALPVYSCGRRDSPIKCQASTHALQ